MEEWRDVPGYTGFRVSNMGNVIGAFGRALKPWNNNRGYYTTWLGSKKKSSVHRLVAHAFIPNPENKPTVNHKNHDRKDNRVENLEWATYSEQTIHSPGDISSSGKRNICIITKGDYVRFQVMIKRNNIILINKKFKTLEEAIAARNVIFQQINFPIPD